MSAGRQRLPRGRFRGLVGKVEKVLFHEGRKLLGILLCEGLLDGSALARWQAEEPGLLDRGLPRGALHFLWRATALVARGPFGRAPVLRGRAAALALSGLTPRALHALAGHLTLALPRHLSGRRLADACLRRLRSACGLRELLSGLLRGLLRGRVLPIHRLCRGVGKLLSSLLHRLLHARRAGLLRGSLGCLRGGLSELIGCLLHRLAGRCLRALRSGSRCIRELLGALRRGSGLPGRLHCARRLLSRGAIRR